LMRYPDEFFDLIPCSVKLKLQAMLRRGEIDYETYCEFLEISMAQEESASIRSRGSLASQKTLNLVPDIEDQDSFTADIVTNERFAEPDPDLQAELEYLKQYQNEQFTPRGLLPSQTLTYKSTRAILMKRTKKLKIPYRSNNNTRLSKQANNFRICKTLETLSLTSTTTLPKTIPMRIRFSQINNTTMQSAKNQHITMIIMSEITQRIRTTNTWPKVVTVHIQILWIPGRHQQRIRKGSAHKRALTLIWMRATYHPSLCKTRKISIQLVIYSESRRTVETSSWHLDARTRRSEKQHRTLKESESQTHSCSVIIKWEWT